MHDSRNKTKNTIRTAAVTGQFYPAHPAELEIMVKSLLEVVDDIQPHSKAIIAPHAGLIYSGPTAATAYADFQSVKDKISRIVLLGPSHKAYFKGLALSSADDYETPIGKIALGLRTE